MHYSEITSTESAFKSKNIDLISLPEKFEWMPEDMRASQIISFKIHTVVAAINGSWVPDWADTNQKKWYAVFDIIKNKDGSAGFGFSDANYYYDCTVTDCGVRLVFETQEKAEHAAKFFLKLYEEAAFGNKPASSKDYKAIAIALLGNKVVSADVFSGIEKLLAD